MFIITDWIDEEIFETEEEAIEAALDWSVEKCGEMIAILFNGVHIKNVWM